MRKDDAPVWRPRGRSFVTLEIEHALRQRASHVGHVEIESLTAVGDEDDVLSVGRPGWFALRLGNTRELVRVASIRRRRPYAIEDDDGQALPVWRPCGIA